MRIEERQVDCGLGIRVKRFAVCDDDGELLDGGFPTKAAAQKYVRDRKASPGYDGKLERRNVWLQRIS